MGVDGYAREGELDGSGKGKGKAPAAGPDREPQASDEARPTDTSVASRIAASAMALGSSLVTRPENPGRLGPADKAGPSITSLEPSTGGPVDYYRSQTASGSGNSMRSTHVQEHTEREEAAFSKFLEGTDPLEPVLYHAEDGLGQVSMDTPSREPHMSRGGGYAYDDGLAVVKLLDSGYEEVTRPEPDVPLATEEARSLREALFGGSTNREEHGSATDWENILNLVPQFILTGNSSWDVGDEARGHLGTPDIAEARQIWADQWWDVLSRYTDDVWGDLGSLAQEAREEIRKVRESGGDASPAETKAIQRLRQILAHVRGG